MSKSLRGKRPSGGEKISGGFFPTEVKIGPMTYSVELTDTEEMGRLREVSSEIEVQEGMAHCQQQETLLHEVLHGIFITAGSRSLGLEGDEEEKVVRLISPYVLMFIRENPEVIDYLREA